MKKIRQDQQIGRNEMIDEILKSEHIEEMILGCDSINVFVHLLSVSKKFYCATENHINFYKTENLVSICRCLADGQARLQYDVGQNHGLQGRKESTPA